MTITCSNEAVEKRLLECFAHAQKLGIIDELLERLHYLGHYAFHDDGRDNDYAGQPPTECLLGWDFAAFSFSFTVTYYRRDPNGDWNPCIMHGGMIFHPGPTGPDETLSVSLDTSNQPRWEVHT